MMTNSQKFLAGLINIGQGLVMVLSLGFAYPSWSTDYLGSCLMKNMAAFEKGQTKWNKESIK